MRMSDTIIPRLEGLSAVNPASVSGSITIAGDRYIYRNGVLNYGGQVYAVSDDNDFVISSKNVPIGPIINGILVPLTQLSPAQSAFYQRKYGY